MANIYINYIPLPPSYPGNMTWIFVVEKKGFEQNKKYVCEGD